MVICNLQDTPYDGEATLKIHSKCDDVMRAIVESLGISVENFTFKQDFTLKYTKVAEGRWKIVLDGNKYFVVPTCLSEQVQ